MNALAALYHKDWRVALNLRRLVLEQSIFKMLFVLAFVICLLAGLWMLFLEGFQFLHSLGGMGLLIIRHLFSLFFFGLGLMLILSNIISVYTTVYRSEEIPFLLVHPISHGDIMLYKLLKTTFLSSWAFFFIIIPFIGAYAWHENLPILFTVLTFVFSIPFVIFCSILGTIVTLLAMRWIPRFRPLVWVGASLVVGCWIYYVSSGVRQETDDISFVISRLVPGIKLASCPLLPSWWVSEGLMASVRGQWVRGCLFFGVLIANALVAGLLVERLGNAYFYQGWQRTLLTKRQTGRRCNLSDFFRKFTPILAPDTRAIVLKDILLLIRDPVQWIQGLLFFGLLGLYFFNLRNLHYHLLPPVWRNLIAFLNVFSLSAVMCSLCSRFVYPQLSLEGHGFWILGLAPTSMARVLLTKFGLALFGMLAISVSLLAVSSIMLGVEWSVRLTALMIAVAMSFALCGLATGLGAVFLDLKERNPAAIISGFGGTLNLALSLAYMIAAILPFGILYHAYYLQHISSLVLRRGLAAVSLWLLIITTVTTVIPLAIGRKSLLSREY